MGDKNLEELAGMREQLNKARRSEARHTFEEAQAVLLHPVACSVLILFISHC